MPNINIFIIRVSNMASQKQLSFSSINFITTTSLDIKISPKLCHKGVSWGNNPPPNDEFFDSKCQIYVVGSGWIHSELDPIWVVYEPQGWH